MEKFLVIQTAFIGDAVLATAVLEKLHRYFPEAQIDLLVRKGNESLFPGHPFISQTLVWDKKANKYKNLLNLLRLIRRSKYAKVINLQRFAATGFLTAFSNAKEKIGFDKNPFRFFFTKKIKHHLHEGAHEVERNNQLIAHFTDAELTRPRLYPRQEDQQEIEQYKTGKYITVSPASVWFTKQFPEEKWVKFLATVSKDYTIYLLGGAGDESFCKALKELANNEQVKVLAGKLSYLQSAALMQAARMNYTNDSAPLHFASAVNAPVAAIFCSTVPGFGFTPLSDISHVIQTKEILPCKPCSLHGLRACPLSHFKCGRTILNSQLLEKLPAV